MLKHEKLFHPSALPLEADILTRHKQRLGQRTSIAKLKFIQLCHSPFTIDDPPLKPSRVHFGHFDVIAQGVSQTNVSKRMKLSVDVDMNKRTVSFSQVLMHFNHLY